MKKILKGIPASAGKARGKVRIILDARECHKLEKGEILVTEMTDPLFTPAFKKAGAILTEIGGLLCHAAITAREFGVPCIVSVKEVTKILKDGQMISIDALTGKVIIDDNS